jgi:hypothetical protein
VSSKRITARLDLPACLDLPVAPSSGACIAPSRRSFSFRGFDTYNPSFFPISLQFIRNIERTLLDSCEASCPAANRSFKRGIIDIHTKAGVNLNGGDLSYYGGSNATIFLSFQFGGSDGRLSYYVLGSYKQNDLGIENPTGGYHAIHDWTEQYKGFANISYLIDDSSRISLLLSGTYSDFQIPANPGQTPLFALAGASPMNFDSKFLSENQHEQNDFAILAYQKSFENVSLQLAAFTRYSSTLFTPDNADTVSAGASYTYKNTTVYADLLYGSGLRSGFANTDELPEYYPFNLGFTHLFHLPAKYGSLKSSSGST